LKKIIHIESGEIIGHCELNFLNEYPRLSRILIGNKQNRGLGYGAKIIQLMVDAIQKKFHLNKLSYVFLDTLQIQ